MKLRRDSKIHLAAFCRCLKGELRNSGNRFCEKKVNRDEEWDADFHRLAQI
jgi:superfamily I DNA and RNA helicase